MSELETRQSAAASRELEPVEAETAELAEADDFDELEVLDATEADLLAIPPRADDLGTALAARPPRVQLPKVTTALAASVLICAGFLGGVLVQKHWGGSSASNRGGFATTFGTGRTGTTGTGRTGTGTGTGTTGGFAGRTGTGGSAITGTVTVVSGGTLYVTAADGSVYTVKTSGTTTVDVTHAGTLSQLKPGQSVVIAGSDDGSGNVTATSITAAGSSTTSGSTNSTGGQ
jgi:hypothetical protein